MEQYIKGFKGFTPVKICGLSPLKSFYFVFVTFFSVKNSREHATNERLHFARSFAGFGKGMNTFCPDFSN